MITFREYQKLMEEVAVNDLRAAERHIDTDFAKFGVRVTFAGHFVDRINDPRNNPPITVTEVSEFFEKIRRQYARRIASMKNNEEGLLKNIKSNLTVAYIISSDYASKMNKLVCKTVMRKKVYGNDNFHNDNETLTVK